MHRKNNKISFDFKVWLCSFLVTAVLLSCFFVYVYAIEKKQGIRVMENYNQNIITSVSQSFSMINKMTESQGVRILNLPTATSLIYRENSDQNQHTLDINAFTREISTIPYLESAVTYNSLTKKFEYYNGGSLKNKANIDDILNNGKKLYPYTPYITMLSRGDGSRYPVITYYCYDFLDGNTMKGTIAISVRFEWLENIMSGLDGMNIMLLDKSGNVLYNYANPKSFDIDDKYRENVLSGSGFTQSGDGGSKYVSAGELGSSDYYVVCEQDYSVIYSDYMKQMRINLFLLALAMAIFTVGAARAISSYISRPIKKMSAYITSGRKAKITDDVFEKIYGILKENPYNTFQLGEMKKAILSYREQNNLVVLLNDGREKLSDDDYYLLSEFFGSGAVVGIELLFEHSANSQRVRDICAAHFDGALEYKIAAVEYNDFVLLIKNAHDAEHITRSAGLLARALGEKLSQLVSVFISAPHAFSDIGRLYGELRFIRSYELIYSRGCILDKKTIEENLAPGSPAYPVREENNILSAISKKDAAEAELLFDKFLSEIIGSTVDDFRASILRLTVNIQAMHEKEGRGERIGEIVRQIPKYETMNDVCRGFAELVDICCRENVRTENVGYSREINYMIEYIERNFSNPLLNADMIAGELKISAPYCSKKFRGETGMSINKYLTEYRLKKAVDYLDKTDESINSVYEKIGFGNESNFYRQFKKYYGVTPGEYKSIKQKKA